MLGLVVLFAIGIYLAISALVVWLAARWAKKHNRRGWVWGSLAAFAMYNLVFWDLIPTLVMHKYYCSTEAGFWVYKTPEQWVKENPGVRETLKMSLKPSHTNTNVLLGDSKTLRSSRTQRFFQDTTREVIFLSLGRTEEKFYDVETGDLIARSVNFIPGSGGASFVSGGSLEAWRRTFAFGWFESGCGIGGRSARDGVSPIEDDFTKFVYQFWKSGEGK